MNGLESFLKVLVLPIQILRHLRMPKLCNFSSIEGEGKKEGGEISSFNFLKEVIFGIKETTLPCPTGI